MTPESLRPAIPSVNESIAAIERLQLLEPLHDAALKEIERLQAAWNELADIKAELALSYNPDNETSISGIRRMSMQLCQSKQKIERLDAKNVRLQAQLASHAPILRGRWRHSNGMIFCGTLRIAKADFDTNPSPEFCAKVFDDICNTMNSVLNENPAPSTQKKRRLATQTDEN
jgi:hypothetical protein